MSSVVHSDQRQEFLHSETVAELKPEPTRLRACPVCGKTPRLVQTMFGTSFVLCFPHAETRIADSPEEAIRCWNAGKMLGKYAEGRT